VTRIGGDEFMIVLGAVVSVSQAVDLANRLRSVPAGPFVVQGHDVLRDGQHRAGVRVRRRPRRDQPKHWFATPTPRCTRRRMPDATPWRSSTSPCARASRSASSSRRDLRFAVALGQLYLVYQPIVRLPTGPRRRASRRSSAGLHPTHGVIPPARFIPLAEESGLICEIGRWVLEEAVGPVCGMARAGTRDRADLYVSVNLSGAQLHDDQIVELVHEVLT
jgi:hypothetical protein